MTERFAAASDEALGQLLAAELPRYTAPARLRAAIVEAAAPPPRRRAAWLAPALASAATALVLVLAFLPLLPRTPPPDPAQRLVRAVVAAHERALMWGARDPRVIPPALPRLPPGPAIGLTRAVVGAG